MRLSTEETELRSVILSLALLMLAPSVAWAHAEEPISEQAYAFEDDDWILKANFGMVSSDYEGFVCEEAFLGGNRFILVPMGLSNWVTFGETSIHVTEDRCSFENVKTLIETPADADGHPESGRVIYLANDDEGAGIWISEDEGRTYTRLDFDTDLFQLTGVRFSGPDTAVVSVYSKAMDESRGAARLIEIDLTTNSITDLPLADGLRYPYILDASPGGMIYLAREVGQTIFWESPEGMNKIESILSWPTEAIISEDGRTTWIAGLATGKSVRTGVVDAAGVVWTDIIPETNATCLDRKPDGDLLICTIRRFEENDLMTVDASGNLTGEHLFTSISGPRADCPAGSEVAEICPVVWEELQRYLGLLPEEDMGFVETDMGSPLEPPPADTPGDDEGCCSTFGGTARTSLWPLLGFFLFWKRRQATGI